jgi:nucleotide-binding universal stress UspA family protein
MTYRSILVHVQPSPAEEPRLMAAADLAKRFDATLTGLGAETVTPIAVADSYGFADASYFTELRQVVRAHLGASERRFERASAGLKTRWIDCEEPPLTALCRLARGADLIVAGGAPAGQDFFVAAPTGELIVSCGRPVLVAPPAAPPLKGEAAVVAWKDTREARRALHDSLPLLARTREVLVVEVTSSDDVEEARARVGDVVLALERHGVHSRGHACCADETNLYGEIDAHAEAIGADLIVAGGYGHSRLQEMVLGGLTRTLLRHARRYVLFSH